LGISSLSRLREVRAVGLEKPFDLEEQLARIDQQVRKGDEPG
jgi:hypothetical protein